jgi:transcriptional regulator with XRE-family HTH domain
MTDTKWDKKIHRLREEFPEIRNINWSEILNSEPEVFRSLAGDVAKSSAPKKEKASNSTGAQGLAQLTNVDYSELGFLDALDVLWGDRSISDMVFKTGISRQLIYNMKRGLREPTFEEMEQIARAFGKDPSFFLEYRIGKALAAIDVFLQRSPETATAWYLKVVKNQGINLQ